MMPNTFSSTSGLWIRLVASQLMIRCWKVPHTLKIWWIAANRFFRLTSPCRVGFWNSQRAKLEFLFHRPYTKWILTISMLWNCMAESGRHTSGLEVTDSLRILELHTRHRIYLIFFTSKIYKETCNAKNTNAFGQTQRCSVVCQAPSRRDDLTPLLIIHS